MVADFSIYAKLAVYHACSTFLAALCINVLVSCAIACHAYVLV